MQNSSELVYIGSAIALICLLGIVNTLLAIRGAVDKESEKVMKGQKREN